MQEDFAEEAAFHKDQRKLQLPPPDVDKSAYPRSRYEPHPKGGIKARETRAQGLLLLLRHPKRTLVVGYAPRPHLHRSSLIGKRQNKWSTHLVANILLVNSFKTSSSTPSRQALQIPQDKLLHIPSQESSFGSSRAGKEQVK